MKQSLTYSCECIVARNQNEIKAIIQAIGKNLDEIQQLTQDVACLRKQSREILGRE